MDKVTEKQTNEKLAVIRVRGTTGVRYDIKATLEMLRLHKKNYCVVLPKNRTYQGMVEKIKDYVTWGEIDESTYNSLLSKRKEEYKGKISDDKEIIKYNKFTKIGDKNIKKMFRLNSPKKGYGRKGVKYPVNAGGALGYRGDKINDLIMRMA
jgi:large subunit ribosomal protein L30